MARIAPTVTTPRAADPGEQHVVRLVARRPCGGSGRLANARPPRRRPRPFAFRTFPPSTDTKLGQ